MSFTRRFVLRGMGATLALPLLPSLLTSREARAQTATNRRNFVMYGTDHGGAWANNMFPARPATGVTTIDYAGRRVATFNLGGSVVGSNRVLSPVLTAPSSTLTAGLVAKMFSLQGLDVPFYLAHHTGGFLGNFARNDGNGDAGKLAQANAVRRTIDQIMAWSPSFYPDLSNVKDRALVLSQRISYNYSNPAAQTGDIQEVGALSNRPLTLFDRLFPQTQTGPVRKPIVDRVLASYQAMRNNPRLSAADRLRIDDHIQRVHELERRLLAGAACNVGSRPAETAANQTTMPVGSLDTEFQRAYMAALNDVLVLALSCGLSRIVALHVNMTFSDFAGDWHQEVAHQSNQEDGIRQAVLWQSFQRFFAGAVVDLAAKLDAVDTGDGKTLLDHSMLVWQQECGNRTHDSNTMPVIGFGSAGGAIRTGIHCDYRHLDTPFSPNDAEKTYPGLLWHQWLGTVLQAMGVPKTEWENPTVNGGYPDYNYARTDWVSLTAEQAWPQAVWNAAGDLLPGLAP